MSFTIDQWSRDSMAIVLKCIQHTTKENMLLLKDLSELWRVRSTSLWLQYQQDVYIVKLKEMGDKYIKTYHRKINMKPTDVKVDTLMMVLSIIKKT